MLVSVAPCAVQEFDNIDSSLPLAERVAKQRQQIKERLGEQHCGQHRQE